MSDSQPKRFQCRHIHADGRRCGSPALRREELCYYHHTSRPPVENPRARRRRQATFDLPLPDATDRTGLQLAIVDVLRRIAANHLDPRRAGLLLYGFQIASLNLPRPRPAALPARVAEPLDVVDEVVLDPNLGPLAPPAEFGQNPEQTLRQSLTERLLAELARGREEIANSRASTAKPSTGDPSIAHASTGDPSTAHASTEEARAEVDVVPTVLPSIQASSPAKHPQPTVILSEVKNPRIPPRPCLPTQPQPVSPYRHAPPHPHTRRRRSLVAPPPRGP